MTKPIFSVENLSCERDDRILFDDLSFTLCGGELVQILGANGSGKSTLLRILAGLYTHYDGKVTRTYAAGELVYLGHKVPIKKSLTVRENLQSLTALGYGASDLHNSNLLSMFGLAGYEDVLCSDLSEGQRRRVALMRIKLLQPKVFFLDEPFSAIDAAGVNFLESLLVDIANAGTLVVFTSHHRFSSASLRQLALGDV